MQRDDLPILVEHGAPGAASQRRRPVVEADSPGDGRLPGGRALVIDQLVILERDRQLVPAGGR
jgi:hypothetical protein